MENRWKIAKLKTIVVLIGLLVNASWTVGQVMPVDITAMAVSPHSNKLSDYYSPNLNKFRVSLLLKDPTEPSWDVYLRVKIQGNWMSLSSRIDYKPNHSIVINSGEFVTVSSSDLEELLLPMNLTVSGPKSNLLSSYGVLAEGAYTMEIAAYDYNTNKLVSRVVALPLNINLNNPPLLVLPPRETVVDLQQIQNLTFQWQDGLGHIRENNTNYCLRLYEVSPEDIAVDGASLLASNRVKKVFEVDDLNMKSYAIQNSIYPLEVGKNILLLFRFQLKTERFLLRITV